jgi:lysozyme
LTAESVEKNSVERAQCADDGWQHAAVSELYSLRVPADKTTTYVVRQAAPKFNWQKIFEGNDGLQPPKRDAECLELSQKGMSTVQYYEGLRLQPYAEVRGRYAIGYGHHVKQGEDYSKGITKKQADALLRKDLRNASNSVVELVNVPVSQGQYDALVSFVFNVGPSNFAGSTLLKKLNSGDYEGAAREFQKWTKAGKPGKTLPGLVARRHAEKDLFRL